MKGKRAKENGVNDAEHRGGSADAERESEDRDDGEAGLLRQRAQGEAKILEEGWHS